MPIIECIPNVSEGRRPDVVEQIASAIRAVPGVRLLDYSSDASHNRSVFTFAGDAEPVKAGDAGAVRGGAPLHRSADAHAASIRASAPSTSCPFVPIEGVTMDAVRRAGEGGRAPRSRNASAFRSSCTKRRRPTRRARTSRTSGAANSKDSPTKMRAADWVPDFGPATPHPSAGASVIGARMPLIAYNINLNTNRLDVAKKIAAAIRHSSGGLRYVKAAGFMLEDRGIVAGLDEPDELREDADLPGVRDGEARGGALRRHRFSRARSSGSFRRPR